MAAALLLFLVRRGASGPGGPGLAPDSPRPGSPVDRAAAPARAGAPPSPAGGPTAPGGAPAGTAPLDAYVDPLLLRPEEIEARRLHRLERSRLAREGYRTHPPYSRPLAENEDLIVPEQIAPTVRPLARSRSDGKAPSVVVRQTQDRVFLRPGTVASVGLEATVEGQQVKVSVLSAVLVRFAGAPPVASEPVLEVPFAPAGPAVAASFAAPPEALGSYTGDLLLRVEAEAAGERGALVYAFVYTGAPPAAFTGATRDRLEDGSVVFRAGVDVHRPGRYRIAGRVDDSAGNPLALARFDGELPAGRLEIPLVLFGKIARDASAVPPFVLRDLEGFRLLDGVHPDRETLEPWTGPYRSQRYRIEDLSPAAWAGGAAPPPGARAP